MTISLTDFLAQIGRAGQEASEAASQSVLQHIKTYCTEDEDGTLIPKTLSVQLGDHINTIPLLALLPATSLILDELDVQFETDVRLSDPPTEDPPAEDPPTEDPPADEVPVLASASVPAQTVPASTVIIGLKRGLAEQDTHITVSARFRMGQPAESIETLRDKLNEHLKGLGL